MSAWIETRRALGAVAGGGGQDWRLSRSPSLTTAARPAPVARCTHCGTGHNYPFLGRRADPIAAMACPSCDRTGSVPMRGHA